MAKEHFILLSFDVEEFDMPLEYNQVINLSEQLKVGNDGMQKILPVINSKNTPCTLFTTATYAIHFPQQIKELSNVHEIASHTFYHSNFSNDHLLQSKLKLEEITGKPITGLRMPRMRKVDMNEVKAAGYKYDSSINPTWLPGRYNNLHLPRTFYKDEEMLRLPASVSPQRIPLFWLSFKNFPYLFFKKLVLQTLKKDGYACLYFHPWEFTDIEQYKLPAYTKKGSKQILLNKLIRLISDLKNEGEFITIQNYITKKALL
ncbi:MAG: DUF3473 domain-containing protein [Bacteroidetes bacterium]|nr:DUF3473 domain-containing protein [Bacteroidota bacterium]